jgi:hypothetical protein
MSLPKSFDLSEPIPSIPDGAKSTLVSVRPISGSSFGPSQIIEFDLPASQWLVPDSLAIRYNQRVSSSAATGVVAGTVYSAPFVRCNTLINGSVVDSINQYAQVVHMIVNTSMGISKKYGQAQSWGYTTASDGNMQYLDGRLVAASQTLEKATVGGPLYGLMLSNCQKNIPLFALGQVRIQLTVDTLANISYNNGTVADITALQLDSVELTMKLVDMGPAVEKMVYDMGPQIFLKTHGWNNSSVAVSAGTAGSQSYVFNTRLASIRSAYICPNRPTGSKQFEFVDITNGNGQYQLIVGQQTFPQMPLDTLNNFGGIFVETARASANIYGKNSEMAISRAEALIDENDATASLVYFTPGKFICGIDLSKISSEDSDVLMSGTSTYNSPITCQVSFGTATTNANSLNLMLDYDAVLVLDVQARQVSVRM